MLAIRETQADQSDDLPLIKDCGEELLTAAMSSFDALVHLIDRC